MNSGDLTPGRHDGSEPASVEIQFALVIARMIETVHNSPEDMRQAIYDLARYKLQEQFTHADARDIRPTQQALETAIRGVEAFSKQQPHVPAAPSPRELASPGAAEFEQRSIPPALVPQAPQQPSPNIRTAWINAGKSSQGPWPLFRRAGVMIAIFLGLSLAVQQRDRLASFARNPAVYEKPAAVEAPRPPIKATSTLSPAPPAAKPVLLRPTDYGVYAVNDGSLIELQLLPGRPPDMRVAVSAAFKIPRQASIPNGHPKFIVFRRDVVSNIPDRAEVRIVAKIAREFTPEASGTKPAEGDDMWVIRNISLPYRSSPIADNAEMYELRSEDPASELSPGHYALVLKNQSYAFSIEGKIANPKHCIERIVATNGTFYSDCKKP
jgi:hypothetical protein